MKPTIRKKDIFSDNRRLEKLFSSDKITQVIQQAKKNVDDFIETSQNLAFEVYVGDAVSEICSGDAIS